MDDLTEEELRQIVSGTSNDWMTALQEQNPDWIMQAIGGGIGNQETGEMAGPIEGYTFYDPKKTEAGKDTFKRYDASGKLIGEQQFKKPGNAWDMTKQFVADVGPLLQFVPTLAPFVRAIGALSAAEQGNILGALASGLPLADKIPGLDKATVTALQNAGKYASVASAAKSKDPMQLLNALSQTPEFGGKVPQELKTAGEYVSKAGALQRAAKGDIGALMGLMPGAAKGPTAGQAASAGYGGAETSGFFDPEAEALAQEQDFTLEDLLPGTGRSTTTPQDDVYEDIESLLARYTDQGFANTPTGDLSQSVDITGTREKDIPDWDFMEVPDRTPGSPTDTTPKPPIPDDDRTSGTTPAGGIKTTGTKTKTPSAEDLHKQAVSALMAMQGKRQGEEKYSLFNAQPLGYELFYGMKG